MFRTMMKSKIHRARVTEANLNYVGSVTIDQDILDKVNILPHEKVQIVNNNNGARLETYVIAGQRGSGVICLNGAAARLVQKDDVVIIVSYALLSGEELHSHRPLVAIMNDKNEVTNLLEQEPPLTTINS
ncbi:MULTISPECIES: aspartate 1-decarboxylase [Virgibacillus]|uniref:Aspartate 1-decarboxylase n=2 Tax=Virgibacillus TaxID=84406 RepID=A0A024QEH7_9BACI|nr:MULTISPECIES: aspartate 1-decarboxylase [Virgibacillus]EQB35190.1 aspartate decarboxylase [Virgibacillus sp. CM-4]MYL42754.1 aspartate 1-decarboxylase [Virgibacillus massiliensis]GGJ69212.1 aspartate 1-decarboxylase [Virgibacillus kapii]CDQ40647.1 Aspartate 1-decarboxylase precursor [Virgibacillus massiliensis]